MAIKTSFTRMSSKGQIVIPVGMREDIKEGDQLLIIKKGDDLILKKSISEITHLSEKSLAEAWLSPEDEEAFAYLQ